MKSTAVTRSSPQCVGTMAPWTRAPTREANSAALAANGSASKRRTEHGRPGHLAIGQRAPRPQADPDDRSDQHQDDETRKVFGRDRKDSIGSRHGHGHEFHGLSSFQSENDGREEV